MLRKAAQTCRRSLVSRLPRCRNLEPPQTSATLGLAGSRATLCPARGGRGAAAAAVSSRGPGPPGPRPPRWLRSAPCSAERGAAPAPSAPGAPRGAGASPRRRSAAPGRGLCFLAAREGRKAATSCHKALRPQRQGRRPLYSFL